ncbi:MAG: hypothetical protein ACJ76Y_22855 [Thermoanaerobaculia bacterium]
MRIFSALLSASVLATVLAACGGANNSQAPTTPVVSVTPDEHAALKKQVQSLQWDIFFLKSRVETLESGEATVSTEEQGYDVSRTKFGPFTVSTRGAAPYLDGYKVKLRIGNLTNANFNGAKLKLGWGPPYDPKNPEEWEKSRKKREISLTNKLPSGSFTDVEIILTPAKPEEIKSFTVGFELDQLELRVR